MKKLKAKNNNKGWQGFDDCPICQAVKNGTADTEEGLSKAFREAERQQSIRMTMRTVNKDDLYYEAMEAIDMKKYKIAEKLLFEARDMDPKYVQTYIGLAHVYGNLKNRKKAHENIQIAFEKTQAYFGKWPRRLAWGDLENRAYLRAIQYRADLYADAKDTDKAIELYRLLLKLNPNDNQGVRYVLAGIYAGIDGKKINALFDQGNRKQNWTKLEKLVTEQNKKHSFWKEPRV